MGKHRQASWITHSCDAALSAHWLDGPLRLPLLVCVQGGAGASVPSRVNEGSPLLGDAYAGGSNRRSAPGYPAAMGAQMDAGGAGYSDLQREQLLADEAFARRLAAEQQQAYGRGEWEAEGSSQCARARACTQRC